MTDISAIVENVCGRLELITAKRNIKIDIDERFRCVLNADPRLITIAVDNLISNAIALCKTGERIVITTNLNGIDVSYEGGKIDGNERRNIWKPFKGVDVETTDLYLSSEIFELHNFKYGSVPTYNGMSLFFEGKS